MNKTIFFSISPQHRFHIYFRTFRERINLKQISTCGGTTFLSLFVFLFFFAFVQMNTVAACTGRRLIIRNINENYKKQNKKNIKFDSGTNKLFFMTTSSLYHYRKHFFSISNFFRKSFIWSPNMLRFLKK